MKIRTDFVTNSSSSGYVLISLAMKSGDIISTTFEYDSGYGGYIWNGNDQLSFDMLFCDAETGEDVLNILEDSIESFTQSITYGDKGEEFRDRIKSINNVSEIQCIQLEEETRWDVHDSPDKHFNYKYTFKKKSKKGVGFASKEEITPSFNNRCCVYGDFSIGNKDGDYSAVADVIENQKWYFSTLFVNQFIYTSHLEEEDGEDFDYRLLIIGDITARQIDEIGFDEYAKKDEYIKAAIVLKRRHQFLFVRERDFVELGEPVIPWDECPQLKPETKQVIFPCTGEDSFNELFDYAFKCGLPVSDNASLADIIVVSNNYNEIETHLSAFSFRVESMIGKALRLSKRSSGNKPLIVSETDFMAKTADLRKKGRTVRPLDCNGKVFAISGYIGKIRTEIIEFIQQKGGTIDKDIKNANVLVYNSITSNVRNAEKRVVKGENFLIVTFEELQKAVELFDTLPSESKNEYIANSKESEEAPSGALNGFVCCLTGDFKYGSKDDVKKYIESLGGSCTASVTKKTNMLIIGACGSDNYSFGGYGQKYVKAKQMQDAGAPMNILEEETFFENYKPDQSECTYSKQPIEEVLPKTGCDVVVDSAVGDNNAPMLTTKENNRSVNCPDNRTETVEPESYHEKPVEEAVRRDYKFPLMSVPDNRKRFLNRKPKKTDKPNRYDLWFRSSFETDKYESRDRTIFHYYCDLVNPKFTKNQQKIEKHAGSIISYFNKTGDPLRANAIRHGYMKSAYDMHALRSFVWTSLEWCKENKSDLENFGLLEIQALCDFIAERKGTNYEAFSKGRKHIGAPILVKNEYGIVYDSFVGFRFSRNDEEIESQLFNASSCNLNELVTLLLKIQPNIEIMIGYLSSLGDSRRTDSDKVMESIVAAYCTFAFASAGPFDILKGPEELDEALLNEQVNASEKPSVSLIDGKVIMAGTTMIGYRGIESTLVLPEGIEYVHVLDLNLPETNSYYKAGTIFYPKSLKEESVKLPDVNKAVFNHDVKSFALYLADGDTFTPCNLRELVFNGTIEKLDGCDWRCGNLTYLELPKGLKSFGKYAFHGAEKLTKVTFPPTVELVEGDLFGKYGDPITITAYENTPSEKIARELARNFDRVTCSLILSPEEQARRDAIEAKKREEQRRLIEEQRRLAEEQRRLAEEQRRLAEEQRRLAEEKRIADINASIDRLEKEKLVQESIVAENGGLFGEKARKRKDAKKKIAILNSQIAQLKEKK